MNKHPDFFLKPINPTHKAYEALRAFHVDDLSAKEIAKRFGYSEDYFNKMRSMFHKEFGPAIDLEFFVVKKSGAPPKETDKETVDLILALREQQMSVGDIQVVLSGKSIRLSTRWIDQVLKSHGLERLPKRTRQEAMQTRVPKKIIPETSVTLDLKDVEGQTFRTVDGGIFYFIPIMAQLGIDKIIKQIGFPETKVLSSINSILAVLAIKLMDKERLSHAHTLSFDRPLGLWAKLNVLPKDTCLSSYSYNVTKEMNIKFLQLISKSISNMIEFSGDMNLDFTAIPYWGDKKVLEKNWSGTRRHALRSVLAALAQDPESGIIHYGNACVRKKDAKCEILRFVDFWKETGNKVLKCLIFDSKFTVLENLRKLDKDEVKFITIRQRNPGLKDEFADDKIQWEKLHLEVLKRKHKDILVNDSKIIIDKYDKKKKIRQIVLKNHGHKEATFILTNDMNLSTKQIILKYARRWLVEKCISEEIDFFHLNLLSSSMVIKVDFDLTMTILANTLYRLLAKQLPGYEKENAKSLYINFIHNGADVEIKNKEIKVKLLKKAHNPIIMSTDMFKNKTTVPWLDGYQLSFSTQNTA